MPYALACALAALAGGGLTAQIGLNVQLRQSLGHPVLAAFVSFSVGALILGLVALAMRAPLPAGQAIAGAPAWAWFGGFLGAGYVLATIMIGPKLGAGLFVVLVIAGQLTAALLIDQLGLLGGAAQPISAARALGAALALAGVWLVQRG